MSARQSSLLLVPVTPAVQEALNLLSDLQGSLSVSMSGSGPSCFALYSSLDAAKDALDANRHKFEKAGLESWCCSCLKSGVSIDL